MSKQFWVKTRDKIAGPFTAQQLKELAARGKLHPQHLVSTDRQRWVPADGLKGLAFPSQDKQTPVPAEQIEKQRPSEHSGARPPLGGIAVEGALEFALQHEKSDQARRAYQDALKQLRGGAGGENAGVAAKVETYCPHCHRHAKGPSSLVGHEIPCPTCGQPFQFEPLPPSAADAGRDSEPVALGDPFQLDFDETLDERPFEWIEERIPQFEPGRLNQWLHSSEKRHDLQGLKLADAAIRAYPDHAVPYVWAAMFLRKLGRHQDAVKCLSRAIRRCKQRTHLYAAMGEVAYETNQLPHMLGWCIRSVIAAWKSGAHIEEGLICLVRANSGKC